MKLSDSLLDAITGGDECRGRDSQLTEWAREARRLEAKVEQLHINVAAWKEENGVVHGTNDRYRAALERIADAAAFDNSTELKAIARSALRPAEIGPAIPCRIHEHDGAFKCYAHNRMWGAVSNPAEPCEGWNAPAEIGPTSTKGERQ